MTGVALTPAWAPADVDAAALWARSGAQWLTAAGVAAPTRLVRAVVGMTRHLDERGAGLAALVGAEGVGVLAERAAALGLPMSGTVSCGGATRLLPAADGWIAVALARPDDVDSVPAWLETDPGDDPWAAVEREVPRRSCADLVERAGLLGLACAAVGEAGDDRPVLLHRWGDAGPTPVDGLVVANLASLWAGPLAGDLLARMGARVITVESSDRPDGARATPAFFEALHGRGESVALALGTDHGRRQLGELLAAVDVVIEGSRPRALAQMGIDARATVDRGPRLWVSITAHGRDHPHAHRVGFGDDTGAAGGLVGRTPEGPVFLADAVADPCTGLVVAATVADLAAGGGRWLADVALARVARSLAATPDDVAPPRHPPSPPRRRHDRGAPRPLGRDTAAVLADLGIGP